MLNFKEEKWRDSDISLLWVRIRCTHLQLPCSFPIKRKIKLNFVAAAKLKKKKFEIKTEKRRKIYAFHEPNVARWVLDEQSRHATPALYTSVFHGALWLAFRPFCSVSLSLGTLLFLLLPSLGFCWCPFCVCG